ncbi:MAG: CDP-alcohol phosphatidyltransferase family protein [Synechococcus sp. SB0678_bin_12]|nr:CDP-alcohol phosphatidyltransferase family protein [Synechococcus sp. SB0678_bin_12]MYI87998.1 CDP-alcohol phosphatidyltransferase family protein [Synechococcus sp. SB0672_bin_10]
MIVKAQSLANGLTVLRGLVAVPLLLALQGGWGWWAWWLLVVGALTDAVDGWLARCGGGGSLWGARLDPLCDKLLLLAPLLWLAGQGGGASDPAIFPIPIPLWAIWLLLAREFLVTEWRSRQPHGAPAHWSGKLKTTGQFLCFGCLLWPGPAQALTAAVGGSLFWAALAMAWLSGIRYIKSSLA